MEHRCPGLLERLRSEEETPVVEPFASDGRLGLMTAYAAITPCEQATLDTTHTLGASPEGKRPSSEIMANPDFDALAIGWVSDRLDCYLVQVNGSCVLEWMSPRRDADRIEIDLA